MELIRAILETKGEISLAIDKFHALVAELENEWLGKQVSEVQKDMDILLSEGVKIVIFDNNGNSNFNTKYNYSDWFIHGVYVQNNNSLVYNTDYLREKYYVDVYVREE
jgi:hypothetical protein